MGTRDPVSIAFCLMPLFARPPPSFCLPTVQVSNNDDHESIANVAVTMLDTRVVPGYIMDPFNPDNALKVRIA